MSIPTSTSGVVPPLFLLYRVGERVGWETSRRPQWTTNLTLPLVLRLLGTLDVGHPRPKDQVSRPVPVGLFPNFPVCDGPCSYFTLVHVSHEKCLGPCIIHVFFVANTNDNHNHTDVVVTQKTNTGLGVPRLKYQLFRDEIIWSKRDRTSQSVETEMTVVPELLG